MKDLHVKGMMKTHELARAIGDVGRGMFTNMLKHKTAKTHKG
ncbi:MAG: hypothetical protein Q7U70_03025 [Methylotenera sp.]|nr:hypothetical protein [Methylotenera sp.]MDP2404390.1 hypothetical protein [Methylotenera sp.]